MRRFLVTGGAGFIGSNIVEALVQRGDEVVVVDNLSTGLLANLADFPDVRFLEGDVADADLMREAVQGVDCVFHQAALASVQWSVERPQDTNRASVDGTLNVLTAAKDAGVRRVVYAASSSLYGDQYGAAKRENDPPDPLSPYAVAKLAGEYYCRAFHHTYGLETVCLRYFNVFGPRQDPASPYSAVIPLFITAMLQGRRPVIYGDGRQSRDFTYVANVADGNLLAADAPDAVGKSINLANGRTTTLLTLIATLNQLLGLSVEPQHEPPRAGDVRDSMADITLARCLLQYEPRVDFEEGLKRSVDYYRSVLTQA